jgi:hypothetical protein
MVQARCGSLDELEEKEQKEYKEETRREAQLPVSASRASAPANSFSVYSLVNLPNPFDNPGFIASLANYDPLDPF